jgi:hypothetical protein
MNADAVVRARAGRRRRIGSARLVALIVVTGLACWLPFQLEQGDIGLYDRMGLCVDENYRVVFRFEDGHAVDADYGDYH